MSVERLQQQIRAAERRYQERPPQPRGVTGAPPLESTADLPDTPQRIVQRAQRLGMQEMLGTEMARDVSPSGRSPILTLYERIIAQNDLLGAAFLLQGAQVSRSVGRIVVRAPSGRPLHMGTGFLVSPRLIMTNNHVIATQAEAAPSIVEFNFYVQPDGHTATPIVFNLDPRTFFVTNPQLDYTLLAVQPVNADGVPLASRGWNPLLPDQGKILVGERANILQHPQGNPQQLALRQNEITALLDDFLHYISDTHQGSSGSPVFNDQWELFALHHAGVPQRDPQGRILLLSGQPWDNRPDTVGQIAWVANEGARISRIVADLENRIRTMTLAQRALYRAAFTSRPLLEESLSTQPAGGLTAPTSTIPSAAPSTTVEPDGSVTWTVPIQIRVSLGTAAPLLPSVATGGTDMDTAIAPAPPDEQPASADLDHALAVLRDCAQRPYYDEAADQAARDHYYSGLAADLPPAERFQQLHALLADTHTGRFSYKVARLEHLYPWVDLHEEGGQRRLHSIYSGIAFDAEAFIREDLAIDARLAAQVRELALVESSLEAIQAQIAALEAQSPFNCEHVVPQSWFDERSPMREDLHHLFACESNCNSFRSNIPYYQFSPEEEAFRDQCGRRDSASTKFEPVAGKGAVARATLYFLLRYPGMVGDEGRELARARLPVLLNWHQAEPVTHYELHRNAAIAEVQGNRNPLIDHPEWATAIDFERGFGG